MRIYTPLWAQELVTHIDKSNCLNQYQHPLKGSCSSVIRATRLMVCQFFFVLLLNVVCCCFCFFSDFGFGCIFVFTKATCEDNDHSVFL